MLGKARSERPVRLKPLLGRWFSDSAAEGRALLQ